MRKRKPTPLEWQALQRLMALHTETIFALANMLGEFISVTWVDKLTKVTYWPLRTVLDDAAWEADRHRYRDLFGQNGPQHALARETILGMLRNERATMPEGGFEAGEPVRGTHLHMVTEALADQRISRRSVRTG